MPGEALGATSTVGAAAGAAADSGGEGLQAANRSEAAVTPTASAARLITRES